MQSTFSTWDQIATGSLHLFFSSQLFGDQKVLQILKNCRVFYFPEITVSEVSHILGRVWITVYVFVAVFGKLLVVVQCSYLTWQWTVPSKQELVPMESWKWVCGFKNCHEFFIFLLCSYTLANVGGSFSVISLKIYSYSENNWQWTCSSRFNIEIASTSLLDLFGLLHITILIKLIRIRPRLASP